jgi:hypothetical protein
VQAGNRGDIAAETGTVRIMIDHPSYREMLAEEISLIRDEQDDAMLLVLGEVSVEEMADRCYMALTQALGAEEAERRLGLLGEGRNPVSVLHQYVATRYIGVVEGNIALVPEGEGEPVTVAYLIDVAGVGELCSED